MQIAFFRGPAVRDGDLVFAGDTGAMDFDGFDALLFQDGLQLVDEEFVGACLLVFMVEFGGYFMVSVEFDDMVEGNGSLEDLSQSDCHRKGAEGSLRAVSRNYNVGDALGIYPTIGGKNGYGGLSDDPLGDASTCEGSSVRASGSHHNEIIAILFGIGGNSGSYFSIGTYIDLPAAILSDVILHELFHFVSGVAEDVREEVAIHVDRYTHFFHAFTEVGQSRHDMQKVDFSPKDGANLLRRGVCSFSSFREIGGYQNFVESNHDVFSF